jgi:DNA transposition AAA+ family ATPase
MTDNASKLRAVGPAPPGDEELRQWLIKYIEEHPHHTTAVLSKQAYIGVSRTLLDDYLAGTYFLPIESGGRGVDPKHSKAEAAIRRYRERVDGTVRQGWSNKFFETRSWMQMQQACLTAINESVIVVVYGQPGLGKTRCLNEFALRKMTTSPLTVLCSRNITTRYFAQKIAAELGLDDKPPIAKLEDMISERLKRTPRPLFIDQANYLNEKSLGTLCYVWEKARVPIVLVGTKVLYDIFTTSNLTQDVRAQLSSRVALHYALAELSPGEVKAIVVRALGDAATDEAVAQIATITGGIHRHVDMIIPQIIRLRDRNEEKLQRGDVKMKDIIDTAGHRLITG